MTKKKSNIAIIVILLISAILRFSYLDKFPLSFNMDEAAKGYNGYSLLTTGKNFRGQRWPLYLTDFSDKLPRTAILYIYSTVPFISLFDLNETATRLPAAIYGTLTVAALYLLALQIFKKRALALYAALFLAISPWHILISRTALEPVTFPPFFLFGWYFLEKGIEKNQRHLYLGSVLLGISLYAYQVALLIIPLFLTTFIIINRKYFKKNKVPTLIFTSLLFLITSPLLYLYSTQTSEMVGHYHNLSIRNFGSRAPMLFFIYFLSNLIPFFLVIYYFIPVHFYHLKN